MGQGKLQITRDLLGQMIGLQDGISIGDIRVDHFRGIVEVQLIGEGLPEHSEGSMLTTLDPGQVIRPRDFNRVRWT
jgi:hypothetical protein